ncbi:MULTISPECIES: oligoribonuclease [unclassified Pseudoalteromonas]|uniref:oligoribonuclease n=1 Tax=unclassified Pseudoalteromonas TaxID=194690 RepID=UPI000CF6E8FB|nr:MULTISPECIES: oligoribonuclease [unclassified Pseudoalteromonas]MBS3797323.1 oligoribonuclease [Pseudoalteromonas sp. BDTF-M6]
MAVNDKNLVWLDLEMTGLDPEHDRILEIATIITDSELNILAQGPVIAIKQSDELLDGMDEWCTNQHGKSGLTARCKASEITEQEAMAETLAFLEQWVPKGASPLCGNSIGQDRRFLVRYMPELDNYFHYRNIDVSTIKELARRWQPEVLDKVTKQGSHLALDDIKDSIMELQVYRTEIFKI